MIATTDSVNENNAKLITTYGTVSLESLSNNATLHPDHTVERSWLGNKLITPEQYNRKLTTTIQQINKQNGNKDKFDATRRQQLSCRCASCHNVRKFNRLKEHNYP